MCSQTYWWPSMVISILSRVVANTMWSFVPSYSRSEAKGAPWSPLHVCRPPFCAVLEKAFAVTFLLCSGSFWRSPKSFLMDQPEGCSFAETSNPDGKIRVQLYNKLWTNEHLLELPKTQLMKLGCLLSGSGSECALSFKKAVFGFWNVWTLPAFLGSWAIRTILYVSLVPYCPSPCCWARWLRCPLALYFICLTPHFHSRWIIYINSLFF